MSANSTTGEAGSIETHICKEEQAAMFHGWITERGGLAVWKSRDRQDATASWSTPLRNADGSLAPQPHPKAGSKPDLIYTTLDHILVSSDREVTRFQVEIESQGGIKVCSKESTKQIRRAVQQAGAHAYYQFDYETQEAVIYASVQVIPLTVWVEQNLPVVCEPDV